MQGPLTTIAIEARRALADTHAGRNRRRLHGGAWRGSFPSRCAREGGPRPDNAEELLAAIR
ncbi:hypothetical protein DX980_35545 [Burkholderia gladioli]|nr:hypothetical protein XF14_01475 [Burkholderia gladioli]PEH82471.1 hypothetical protein CRM95_30875 [Burkholderia gladioli]WAG24394.1 hypothetical protein DX980_35545 [Burkholderia gladioli]